MRHLRASSDQRLLAATRAGDADAFGVFFTRHSVVVLKFVRRRVGNAELAADLTAETFAAALVAVHRGQAREVPNGEAWLCGIARHKIADSYREGYAESAARRELRLHPVIVEADVQAAIDGLCGDAPLHAALDALSAAERQAVLERVVLEHDYHQIARGAGSSETLIRQRVSRGLARLRAEMGAKTK